MNNARPAAGFFVPLTRSGTCNGAATAGAMRGVKQAPPPVGISYRCNTEIQGNKDFAFKYNNLNGFPKLARVSLIGMYSPTNQVKTVRHTVQKALIAAAATAALSAAQATPVATWQTGVFSNTASFAAAGVTASNLTGNIAVAQQANGYVGYDKNAWSVYGSSSVASAAFTLTLSTTTAMTLSTFDFTLFNNDCQVNGNPLSNCSTATWGVQMSLNGGSFSSDLLSFNAGAPYAETPASVQLNQALDAGDSLTMRVYAINAGTRSPGTGQYYFHDISLNTATSNDVPEPGTLALTGLALLAAARLRRKA